VANEFFQTRYTLERSRNGQQFTALKTLYALNLGKENHYQLSDEQPFKGSNFYRIRTEDEEGKVSYSAVVEIKLGNGVKMQPHKGIKIYPNLVTTAQTNLSFSDMKAGTYYLTLVNQQGVTLSTQKLKHGGTNQVYPLQLPLKLLPGKYNLRVHTAEGALPINLNLIKE
jgi:hypothetical protein